MSPFLKHYAQSHFQHRKLAGITKDVNPCVNFSLYVMKYFVLLLYWSALCCVTCLLLLHSYWPPLLVLILMFYFYSFRVSHYPPPVSLFLQFLFPPFSIAPSTVPIMHQVSATMRSITLSWPQPEQPNGIILDYEIRYYEKLSRICIPEISSAMGSRPATVSLNAFQRRELAGLVMGRRWNWNCQLFLTYHGMHGFDLIQKLDSKFSVFTPA